MWCTFRNGLISGVIILTLADLRGQGDSPLFISRTIFFYFGAQKFPFFMTFNRISIGIFKKIPHLNISTIFWDIYNSLRGHSDIIVKIGISLIKSETIENDLNQWIMDIL